MLRILLVSNAPWIGSGYGTQIAQLGKQLRTAGHEVAFFANYGLGGCKTVWEGFRIYPSGLALTGDDLLHGHADDWKADVVLVLYDAFGMDGRIIKQMKQHCMFWQPVDCEPMGRADLEQFRISGAQPVAMSRFGERMMTDAGLKPLYAPHGIDTRHLFLPAEKIPWDGHVQGGGRAENRRAIRQENDLPEDAFIIGMNVHNKDAERKAVFEQMSAFALFHRKHPDSLLLCHTMPHPVMSGNNLVGDADFLGIGDAVRWADPYSLLAGNYTQEDMVKWYAQLDLYSGASRGEGFGLPLIEAQACGVPVVTTDAAAMTELAGPGWLVGGQPYRQRGHQSIWITPDIGELADAYEDAYNGEAARRSDDARLFGVTYDADIMYETYWSSIWKDTEAKVRA